MAWTRIDPHTHSTCSDGTDTPTRLMEKAREAGLDVIGLTDHDTTAGWDEAARAVPTTGVALLRGTEISCAADGVTVHMLSYLHDPAAPGLRRIYADVHDSRRERVADMVERLSRDFPITLADVEAQAGEGVAIGRPHIADALIAAGCFTHRNEAFASVLSPRSPYYVRYQAPDPLDVIAAIREAGGVPIFAHPRPLGRQRRVVPTPVIARWVDAGLAGLEVDHPDHTAEWRCALHVIAGHFGLIETGSSDFHGRGKTTRLGENLTRPEALAAICEAGALPLITP